MSDLERSYRIDAAWAWCLGQEEMPSSDAIQQQATLVGVQPWVIEHLLGLRFDVTQDVTESL
mgnify:CR=1 FL=1